MRVLPVLCLLTLSACGTLTVQIHEIKIDRRTSDEIIVEVTTDREVAPLKGSKWAAVVQLRYRVDQNQPVTKEKEFNRKDFENRWPFVALESGPGSAKEGRFASFWKIQLKDNVFEDDATFEYDFEDGRDHSLEFSLYGAGYFTFSSLRSNRVQLRVPAR